ARDAARAAGVEFFIHVSTSAVFGRPARCPITDHTPLRPLEAYGCAKLAGEERVAAAARAGLACAIVRPRTLVGVGRLGIFQILYEWVREWRPRYGNAEMLVESYDWFLAHPESAGARSVHRSAVPEKLLSVLRRLS